MSSETCQASTLVELLRWRAQYSPNSVAYTFLQDGETESAVVTYAQLDQRARAIAAVLQQKAKPGDRALLLFPTGLEYIASFFGCLYAGVIAVPTYPPRSRKAVPKLLSLAKAAGSRVVLASEEIHLHLGAISTDCPPLAALDWLRADSSPEQAASQWAEPRLDGESVAFLQFTSGSTSAPRGVIVTHANLLRNQEMIRQAFGHGDEETVVSWLPLYHDMGLIGMILQPLYLGCRCVLMPPMAFIQAPQRWLNAITRYRATSSGGPNFAYQLCVDKVTPEQRSALDLSSWSVAFNGAEPIRAETMERFAGTFADCGFRRQALYPCYGLAEATLLATGAKRGAGPVFGQFDRAALESMQVKTASDDAPITLVSSGYADPRLRVTIVKPATLDPCGKDQVGEIWLAGNTITQGYWDQPEATRDTFAANLPGDPTHYLRTGDLGFLKDDELYVTGRLKDTLIIGGRNLYPQDIELTVERCHPALRAGGSAAFAVDINDEEQLVLVSEVRRDAIRTLDSKEVFAQLRYAVLEGHEIPLYAAVLIKPGQLPKTSSGKVRRQSARKLFLEDAFEPVAQWRKQAEAAFVPAPVSEYGAGAMPPRNAVESALADIWREVLEIGSVGVHDNLLEWGAQSLQATQICSRIAVTFGVEIPVSELLDYPTIAKLATRVEHKLNASDDRPTAILQPVPVPRPQHLPLAWSQERMWFLHQMQPESAAYNMAVGVRFSGPLVSRVLELALNGVIQRHEVLRTTFEAVDGVPTQKISTFVEWHLTECDLTSEPESERESRLQEIATQAAMRVFDLERGPLFRIELYKMGEQDHVLAVNIHHVVSDAWSLGILIRELGSTYEALIERRQDPVPELPMQYADFACWQRLSFSRETLQGQIGYWREQLRAVPVLSLPTDHPRPPVQGYRGGLVVETPHDGLLDRVRAFSRERGVTPFMTIMSAFLVLLQRYSGQGDIAVGTSIANRHHVATERLVGTFVNTLVMRNNLADHPTFSDLLARVRRTALTAYAHQDLSFEQLIAELQPVRDLSHSPLFEVMFNFINVPIPENRIGDTVWSVVDINRQAAQFDLTLGVIDTRQIQRISFEFNSDLFDESTIRKMLEQLQTVLADAVTHPESKVSRLDVLPEDERAELLIIRNQTSRDFPRDLSLHAACSRQAEMTPDAVAAVYENTVITYRELDKLSDQLSAYLQGKGLEPGHRVGICLHRSLEMLTALLGILKAGAAYVPLDPAFPRDRLRYMLEDSGARMLVSQSEVAAWLLEGIDNLDLELICMDTDRVNVAAADPVAYPPVRLSTDSLAYVIYTSGSTGRPKGVQIPHRAIMNFLSSMAREPGLTAKDILLSVTTLSFDIAVLEIYLPLITGARLVMVGREVAYDPQRLAECIAATGTTVMQATPATWRMLLDSGWEGKRDLKVLCGGENLPRDLAARLLDRVGSLWNMYGPTETTVWSAIGQIHDTLKPISVGTPIANTQIYILDEQLQPVPTGAAGELWIGGEGLARGYLNQPELTEQKFIASPFANDDGSRIYGTGDLARYLSNGRIEVQGRKDFQVKVRGFRIELGEVEATLAELPGVRQAAVVALEDNSGSKRLVAYLVANSDQDTGPDVAGMRQRLLEILPDYMVPTHLVFLDALPLTPNGKIDRLSLPDPGSLESGEEGSYVAPRTPYEETLARIFSERLDANRVGVQDNFFALGGHSLVATRVISEIQDALGVKVPLRTLFEHPTVDALALQIGELKAATLDDAAWQALTADIEHLSEEEIQALVQEEQNGTMH